MGINMSQDDKLAFPAISHIAVGSSFHGPECKLQEKIFGASADFFQYSFTFLKHLTLFSSGSWNCGNQVILQ